VSARRGIKGRHSIYQDSRGIWRGQIDLAPGPGGKRRRKTVSGKTSTEVLGKMSEALNDVQAGVELTSREVPLVKDWLKTWLGVVARTCKDSTMASYESDVYRHAIPVIGEVRLDRLTTEHVEHLYDLLYAKGLSTSTVSGTHRTLRAAFNEAVKRSWMVRNPVKNARPRKVQEGEHPPLTVEEAKRVLAVARERRNAARWTVALSLGLRQGEALGLRWCDVDLEAGYLYVRKALARERYKHGCAPVHLEPTCGEKPIKCPARIGGGLRLIDPKSDAGKREVKLPKTLAKALATHKTAQAGERLKAGTAWAGPPPGDDACYVFANLIGKPIGSKQDWEEWTAILKLAGVDHRRLHDARHTAATMMLLMGVHPRSVMAAMGWSSMSMVQRYQHVPSQLLDEIAEGMEAVLLSESEESKAGPSGGQ